MPNKLKYDIFISYRRKGGYDTAKLIFDRLRLDGYSVSFDVDTLVNGNFDVELETRVSNCKDFLLVLSPGVFDKFFETAPDYDPENDWVRREIACALKANKNIIPLALDGFVFPKKMPDDVKDIVRKNAIDLYPKYFEAAYEKMKSFMVSKPSFMVKHQKIFFSAVALIFLGLAALLYFSLQETAEQLDAMQKEREERQKMRQQERTYHWGEPDDEIGQIIFEKIEEARVYKTECSGNGRIVKLSKVICRGETEITCFFTPRISFTSCDNRPITFLEMSERFRSSPQPDTAAAKKELANKLREADFSEWVSAIKKDFK